MAISPEKRGAGKRTAELFTASGDKPRPHANFVLRLLHGGFPLTVTFWIFFVSVPLTAHLIFSRLIFPVIDVRAWHGSTLFLVWAVLSVLYGAVVCLGLWRSREHFTGNPLWARLAGPAAVLGAAGFLFYAAMIAGSWFMLVSA